MFPILRMMVLDVFQTTNLVFVTFYRSRQVLKSKIHRKTVFGIDLILNLSEFWSNFGKNLLNRETQPAEAMARQVSPAEAMVRQTSQNSQSHLGCTVWGCPIEQICTICLLHVLD